jgi:hypothetical protein
MPIDFDQRNSIMDALKMMRSNYKHGNKDSIVDHDMVTLWHFKLRKYTDEQIMMGLDNVLDQSGSFFPTVGKFIECIVSDSNHDSIEAEARDAFKVLYQAISKGPYVNIHFKNTAIAEYVRQCGGWKAVCEWQDHEIDAYKKRDFLSAYPSLKKNASNYQTLVLGFKGFNQIAYVGDWKPEEKRLIGEETKRMIEGTVDRNESKKTNVIELKRKEAR